MKIISEDQAVETRTSELLFEWEKGKPVQGNVRPDIALNNLAIYEGKFSRLKEDRDNVARAKEALELMEPGLFTLCKSDFPYCPLCEVLKDKLLCYQCAKKVMSDSPGLVDFAIGPVNPVLNLPKGQVKYFEEFN